MVKIVSEIGCNHQGDFGLAEQLIAESKRCHVDYVKFQKRSVKELLTVEEYQSKHPNSKNSFGQTYGEHREFLEFNLGEHQKLMKLCHQYDVNYACSVWDLSSAKEISSLGCDYLKIPSACNLDFSLLSWVAQNFKGQIHISTGMTTKEELDEIVKLLQYEKAAGRVILYACTSGYPVTDKDVCLKEIINLKSYLKSGISDIGFSGHHNGIAIDMGAIALGANWIERHFTLDNKLKGTDHIASLEPMQLKQLVSDTRSLEKALIYKNCDILPVEIEQRNKLKRLNEGN